MRFTFPRSVFMERASMNEALLIFLSFLCLRAARRYLDADRKGWLLAPAESDELHVRSGWQEGTSLAVW